MSKPSNKRPAEENDPKHMENTAVEVATVVKGNRQKKESPPAEFAQWWNEYRRKMCERIRMADLKREMQVLP
jgi:hypothetical protein